MFMHTDTITARAPQLNAEQLAMLERLLDAAGYRSATGIDLSEWQRLTAYAVHLADAADYTHPSEISRRIRTFDAR